MITVEHLRRTYGSFTAVDDLSFQVAPAEIVGLIGPNGAGKTTTLRSLAGILRPTAGHVRIDGHDLVQDPIEAKRRLAFMPGCTRSAISRRAPERCSTNWSSPDERSRCRASCRAACGRKW
jgi:ABC-type multidrug transport system ATPase subunit